MKVINEKSIINLSIFALIVTILVELFIAVIFKIKNIWVVVLTNFISNLFLQVMLLLINKLTIFIFIGLEIVVVLSELLVYDKFLKGVSKKVIITYTLLANIVTALITFIIR